MWRNRNRNFYFVGQPAYTRTLLLETVEVDCIFLRKPHFVGLFPNVIHLKLVK